MAQSRDTLTANLWEIADYTNGRATKPSELVKQGMPVIKIAELSRGITKQTNLVPKDSVAVKHVIERGDLLFAWSGTIGVHVFEGPSAALNQHIFKVVAKEMIDQDFLRFLLENELENLQGFVEEKKTTMGHVTIANLKTVEVTFPKSLEKQRKIASYLSGLDDLISRNNALSATLEEIAQALFKSWFLDFEPVKAKMAGEKPLGMDEETAAQFPDCFEESRLGPIPKGWVPSTAGDLFEIGIGRTPPRKEAEWFCDGEVGVPWVSIRDMGKFATFSDFTNEGLTYDAVEKFRVPIVPVNTVLMSFKLTVGKLCITDRQVVTNEAIAHFSVPPSSPMDSLFTYLWLRNFDMDSLDSTSSIGIATNSRVIRKIDFLVPPPDVLKSFHQVVAPNFELIQCLRDQTRTLNELRKGLLPRLISGGLQIPDEMLAS